MLADAPGHSMTEPKLFIRKRPGTSRSVTTPCQGRSRGFDPRFPLHTSLRPLRLDFSLGLISSGASLPRRAPPPLWETSRAATGASAGVKSPLELWQKKIR